MILRIFEIKGESMLPSLSEGSFVLVSSIPFMFRNPRVEDIVIARDPRDRRILVKRIEQVNNEGYFLIGDNKEISTDSREFGPIQRRDILGKMILVFKK